MEASSSFTYDKSLEEKLRKTLESKLKDMGKKKAEEELNKVIEKNLGDNVPEFYTLEGFDTSFHPVFFEDVDFCLRAGRAGRKILHVPNAPFTHQGGGSVRLMTAGDHYAAWFGNLERYAGKHHGAGTATLLRLLMVPGAGLRLGSTILPGGGGAFGRGPRAAACLQIALRSISPWHPASQSMS